MFAVIALVAVTGFAGVVPNFKLDKPEQVYADEITALGLEYKNGWYLIDSAEDYYAMRHCVNTGIGNTAKYKQVCNIDLADADNPYEGEIQKYPFSGKFNGGGFQTRTGKDAKPQMGIIESEDVESGVAEEINTESNDGIKQENDVQAEAIISKYGNVGFGWLYSCIEEDGRDDGRGNGPATISCVDFFIEAETRDYSNNYGVNELETYAIGGLVGFAKGKCRISDCRVTYLGSISYEITDNSLLASNSVAFGGILGSSIDDTSVSHCIVRNIDVSVDTTGAGVGSYYIGHIAGYLSNSATLWECFSISPVQLRTRRPDGWGGKRWVYSDSCYNSPFWPSVTRCVIDDADYFSVGGGVNDLISHMIRSYSELVSDLSKVDGYVLCDDINNGEIIQANLIEEWSVYVYCATKDGDTALYSGYKTITAYTNQTMGSIVDKNSNTLDLNDEIWHFTSLTFTASSRAYYGKGNKKFLTPSENPKGVWFSEFVDEGNNIAKMYAHYSKTSVRVTAYLNGGSLGPGILLPDPTNSRPLSSITVNDWTYTKSIGETNADGEVTNWKIAITKDTYSGATYGTFPRVTAPSGYDLKGWYLDRDGLTTKVESGIPISGTQIYAVYEPKDVQLYANGGEFANTLSNGWICTNFQLATKSIAPGVAIGALPSASEATRLGYSLDGWYTSADGGTKIDSSTKVEAGSVNNGTYYAHWTEVTIEIYLHAYHSYNNASINLSDDNGWTKWSDNLTYQMSSVKFSSTIPEYPIFTHVSDSYTFEWWTKDNNGDYSAVDKGIKVDAGDDISNVGYQAGANEGYIDLYMYLKPIEYTIFCFANGNTHDPAYIGVSSSGYWNNGGATIGVWMNYKLKIGDKWSTLVSGKSSSGTTFSGVKAINTLPNNAIKNNRPGYKFIGWYYGLDSSKDKIEEGDSFNTAYADAEYTVDLYAKWEPITYYIQYDKNTPTGDTVTGSMANSTHQYGVYSKLSANGYAATYYSFVGWNTSSNGTGDAYNDKAAVYWLTQTDKATITLYAQWATVEYNIKLDATSGGVIDVSDEEEWIGSGQTVILKETIEINADGEFVITGDLWYTFPRINDSNGLDVTKVGYTGVGWFTKASEGSEVGPGESFAPNVLHIDGTTIIFYAHWTPITYYIKYEKNAPSGVTVSGSMDNSEHTYDVEKELTANAYSATSYVFMGWSKTSDGELDYADEGNVINLSTEDGAIVPLYAKWTRVYTITLDYNGGAIDGYSISDEERDAYDYPKFTDNGDTGTILYTQYNTVTFPTATHMGKRGYRFRNWSRSEWANTLIGVTDVNEYFIGIDSGSTGTAYLTAQWTENSYTVKFSSWGSITGDENVNYSKSCSFPAKTDTYTDSNGVNYRFVGWTATEKFVGLYFDESKGTLLYSALKSKIKSVNLDGSDHSFVYISGTGWADASSDYEWKPYIYQENKTFTKLLHSGTVTFYAVWTPIYTVTINAGNKSAVVNGDGQVAIDYFTEYKLQKELSVIGDNSGTANGVYWKYHYVTGWQVEVGGQYKILDDGKWMDGVSTDLVAVGVNLQYLQGNIEITPDWDPFKFNVIFKTAGNEDYKEDYDETTVTTEEVIYGNEYIFMPYVDLTKPKKFVVFTEIKGYSLNYACPYADDKIDTGTKLRMYGTWDYDLDYQHNGSGYYIEVEGYYLPNLYKLKFNINEPYGTPTTETSTSNIASTASNVIEPLTLIEEDDEETSVDEAWTYIVNDDYNNKPGKLFKDSGNNYYIYLLNDSEMTYNSTSQRSVTYYKTYSYNYDSNAHGFEDRSWTLPTWTIPYYEMQYFYIIKQNNVNDITMYQMANVEGAHTEIAEEKITEKVKDENEEEEIDPVYAYDRKNWTYEYCNSNNANGEGYTINLYWYRKRINLEVSNLFDEAHSPNGYTVVQETEQIRLKPGSTTEYELEDHSPYHVVIYINDGESNKYYTRAYPEDPTTNIKTELFDGENISTAILEAKGWAETNSIEIYFGNKFTLMARDQSVDHSLNDFIGYRFKDFTLDEIFQTPETSGSEYSVSQDLQEIDEDTPKDGVTKYIKDRATYNVATNFEKISYTITYQISDESLGYTSKYGHIRLQGKDCNNNTINISSSNPNETRVTLQVNGKMKSTMNVDLGIELLYWRSASKADSLESIEDTNKDQIYNLELTPEFLRNHIYYATNDPYAVDNAELTIHAICQAILFDINVNVKDMETGEVIRTYTLSEETDNLLFTLEDNLTQVSIDQAYDIIMLNKRDGDSYAYYYQDIDGDGTDTQYAVLRLYIEHSSSHSTEQMVTKFSYPADSLGSVSMVVNHSLLDYTINYSQFIEVKDVNRYLDFYIEVSPTIEIKFSDYIYDGNDAKIGARKLTIMGQEVASCSEDGDLEVKGSYLGYVGQEVTFNAVADSTYYQGVRLMIAPPYNYLHMPLSADSSYEITQACTIYVIFVPKTYTYTIDCKYDETLYANCRDVDVVIGEERWEAITLSDGTKIFYDINVADVDGNKGVAPNYYYGDKLEITAKLSTDITGFELNVYKNGIKLTGNNGVYTATFTGDETTKILIEVIPQPENVVIKTNPDKEGVADVHVKINNGEIKPLAEYGSGIDLIDGDGLTVYVKSKLGYIFKNQHIKDDVTTDLTVKESEDMSGYVEFQMFTSYQAIGVKGSKGTYFLQFNEVPIVAEFVYYSTTDEDVADAGKNTAVAQISRDPSYTETSVETFMPGAELKVINRVDNPGYRFLGYTYAHPMGVDGAVELDSRFTISEDIYDYLSTDYPTSIIDGRVRFKIYANYINQYKITVKTNNVSKTKIDLKTKIEEDEGPLSQNIYYDHGTLVIATLSTGRSNANDTVYYKFNVEINGVSITETSSGVTEILKTSANSLSGFTLTQELVENMVIDITVSPEKYYTNLQEHLEYSDKTEDKSSSLEGITELKLTDNVYYKVESEHYYDNNVKIYIYTAKPKNVGEWYYELDNIELNGISYTVGQPASEHVGGVEFYKYEITYTLNSDYAPNPILDIYYKAYYYVEVNIVVNIGD